MGCNYCGGSEKSGAWQIHEVGSVTYTLFSYFCLWQEFAIFATRITVWKLRITDLKIHYLSSKLGFRKHCEEELNSPHFQLSYHMMTDCRDKSPKTNPKRNVASLTKTCLLFLFKPRIENIAAGSEHTGFWSQKNKPLFCVVLCYVRGYLTG